jgi:DNA (cytosine-5)-methyltransferase 1
MVKKKYTFIDLFAGCGGLSEGFLQTETFEALAHIEWETPMVNTLRNRLITKWGSSRDEALKHVIKFDIQKTDELFYGNWSDESIKIYENENHADIVQNGLDSLLQGKSVDLIIGGPPCQAYSLAGRAQDPNSMKNDYRNYLFESFVKIVEHYQPKLFVFENVPGLLSACPGDTPVRYRIYEAFKKIGYEIKNPDELKNAVYSSADFNTPQDRNRVIIFGVKKQGNLNLQDLYEALTKRKQIENRLTVKDAIGSMPKFKPLDKPIKAGRANVSHELIGEKEIPSHIARYHSPRDVNVFREWLANDMNHASTAERLEYYTKITGIESNHIKYRALEWDKPSPTIVSHLYKDGLMFIHPDIQQLRSITIREAALLQSFPMDYEFLGSNASCFKMIGNAVPVSFAKEIAYAIVDVLNKK